ncbi:MAG: methyltransferase domain-containing protein [Acidobacteriota bacterium]
MRQLWDDAYREGEHAEHWEDPEPPQYLSELVRRSGLTPGARCLDLGCGGGLEALHLAGLGLRVVGLDLSPAALAVARGRGGGAASPPASPPFWVTASALAVPLATESVDLVHDRGCFHLFEEPGTRHRYAAEVARVLAPGRGRLLLLGAAEDDEERGLVGVDGEAVDRFFEPLGFRIEILEPLTLRAPAGDVAGTLALLAYGGTP